MIQRPVRIIILLTFVAVTPSALAVENRSAPMNSCPIGQHWVREHHRRAYTRTDGTHVKATTVAAHCSTNPPGYDHWKPLIKPGRPAHWPNLSEKSKPWSPDEQERMLSSLGKLPKYLWLNSIRGFYKMTQSLHYPNPASADRSGNVTFYDSAFASDGRLDAITAHELGHLLYASTPELSQSYRIAAGWLNVSDNVHQPDFIPLRKDFVKPDGSNSPQEDFANNLESYLHNPQELKSTSPGVFLWFQNQFANSSVTTGGTK